MPERNTPQKTLESWKQIAAYLDRSERTVRRWEATEGLPVHRREHEKQDTVFAFKHEIEAWSRLRTKCPTPFSAGEPSNLPVSNAVANTYLVEHDAITRTMHSYIAGTRAVTESSCDQRFIPPQPFLATVREWSTRALASHALKSSRVSPSFIWR